MANRKRNDSFDPLAEPLRRERNVRGRSSPRTCTRGLRGRRQRGGHRSANLAAKAPRRSPELGDRDRNVDRAAGRPGPCLSHSSTAPRPSDRPDFAPRGGQTGSR